MFASGISVASWCPIDEKYLSSVLPIVLGSSDKTLCPLEWMTLILTLKNALDKIPEMFVNCKQSSC